MSHYSDLQRPASGKRRLRELLVLSDNRNCADCGAPDPKWASANIGVFICLKCFPVHRSLGTHISKVLSVTLDEWSDDEIDAMIEVGGNSSANSIYEAFMPEGVSKPGPDASHDERNRFIRSKYEKQEFLKPSLRITSGKSTSDSLQSSSFSRKILNSFGVSNSSQNTVHLLRTPLSSSKPVLLLCSSEGKACINHSARALLLGFGEFLLKVQSNIDSRTRYIGGLVHGRKEGMVEFIGLLKVKIKKGMNLAIRDMMSSDPYVVLTLGKQTVQTTVAKSNLNPVWNEDLMLSVPQDFGPVKLQVFDYDTFSADDIMGEAELDIQPLITSAMAYGDPEMFGDMQIGKWLKSSDNALIEDSTIKIVDGKVRQEVSIKLQNVESGDLELDLEWMSLDQ